LITSINLNSIPFISSTDATRASMTSKQIQQALTSLNTEIPYVVGSDYLYVRDTSSMGIMLAKDDGKVVLKNDELLIIDYKNSKRLEELYIPLIKKTYSMFGTTLRFSIDEGKKFKKGDILASYDCFLNGIPTYGYNVFTGFFPFFGYNHEDSVVISESFAEKATVTFIDKVVIPIYEYTLMKQYYKDVANSYIYFPSIGQKIKDDVICCLALPKGIENISGNSEEVKNKVQAILRSSNLSHLLSLNIDKSSNFVLDGIKTKLSNGAISGMKIHRLKKEDQINMIDKQLQDILEKLYLNVYVQYIAGVYHTFSNKLPLDFTEQLMKKYYIYQDQKSHLEMDLHDVCYLLEFEVTKQDTTHYGDKIANRYAGKGIVSLILPDELRPIAQDSQKPIDLIFNPFSVFSRQNLGQVLEGVVAKSVMKCDEYIRENPDSVKEVISWLNNAVIRNIDLNYHNRIKTEIIDKLDDQIFKKDFINSIIDTNLFIEAPCFAKVDIVSLVRNSIPYKETVLLKKELIKYLKQKLKLSISLPNEDIQLSNIFCAPMYVQKLAKLTSKIMNARDLGPVKSITKQPVKGRAKSGGSKLGQMELEALIANGVELTIKEFLSVKSDWTEGKNDLIYQLISKGEYQLPTDRTIKSRTKEVVDVQLQFLKE